MNDLTIKAEKIIQDILDGKYTSDKWDDPDQCVVCGKELSKHSHWEFDLDENNNSSWHKDFTGNSVTGWSGIGYTCAKNLGIYKTLKKYEKVAQ